jgi:transposase-like protein
MPSKYTDEIENSSDTWRAFSMTRKAKFSAEKKLSILNELSHSSMKEVTSRYSISRFTISSWQLIYKHQGIEGLRSGHHNRSYSRDFKLDLVRRYQESTDSLQVFAIKNGLKSKTQLSNWIIQYNESKLKAYTPRKRDSIMPGRKTTFEERLSIIEELIKHDIDYNWAVDKYHVSYQQVYGWYQKYRKSGNDPQSLRDRRGKAKPKEAWTEVDQLKAENRLLKAQLLRKEMEDAYAKKVIEIRNREVNDSSNNKLSKN